MLRTEMIALRVNEMEAVMVQQFRGLQNLVEITRAERQALIQRSMENLNAQMEAKEAQLDRLSLLEDRFRETIHNLALACGLGLSDTSSLTDLLPGLPKGDGEKLSRLADGILNLVRLARDLNVCNQALVQTQMDWVQACQAFLYESLQPVEIYAHPAAQARRMAISGMDVRI